MTVSIKKLRGITSQMEAALKANGIYNSDQFLMAARNPAGRQTLAGAIGVAARDVLELANRADLARVRGIGGVFSDLLENAGVDTVRELAARRPDNLYAKLVETNAVQHVAGRAPTMNAVKDWVAQAKNLTGVLEY